MFRTTCPECGEPVEFGEDPQVGDQTACAECQVDLEILSLSPLVIDYVLAEDWDEDWDEQRIGEGVRWDDG
jgi:lysine biosynthesis protein LysW